MLSPENCRHCLVTMLRAALVAPADQSVHILSCGIGIGLITGMALPEVNAAADAGIAGMAHCGAAAAACWSARTCLPAEDHTPDCGASLSDLVPRRRAQQRHFPQGADAPGRLEIKADARRLAGMDCRRCKAPAQPGGRTAGCRILAEQLCSRSILIVGRVLVHEGTEAACGCSSYPALETFAVECSV